MAWYNAAGRRVAQGYDRLHKKKRSAISERLPNNYTHFQLISSRSMCIMQNKVQFCLTVIHQAVSHSMSDCDWLSWLIVHSSSDKKEYITHISELLLHLLQLHGIRRFRLKKNTYNLLCISTREFWEAFRSRDMKAVSLDMYKKKS